jgi:hypothetical protein
MLVEMKDLERCSSVPVIESATLGSGGTLRKPIARVCSLEQRCKSRTSNQGAAHGSRGRKTAPLLPRQRRGMGVAVAGIAASRFGHSE